MQKSKLTGFIFLLVFFTALSAHAAGTVLEVGIPGVAGAEPGKPVSGIVQYISFLYTFVLGFVGIAGFASLVFWGAVWAGSGIVDKKRQAMDGIKNAFIGIGIALTAFILLNTINPDLVMIRLPLISDIGITSRETTVITTGSLDPQVADLARQLILTAKNNYGIDLYITTGYRSPQQQDIELSKGSSKVGACRSYHQYGLAFDLAMAKERNSNGVVTKATYDGDWATVGMIGQSLGLKWGGEWGWDLVHFEYRNGKNIAALEQQCFQSYSGA